MCKERMACLSPRPKIPYRADTFHLIYHCSKITNGTLTKEPRILAQSSEEAAMDAESRGYESLLTVHTVRIWWLQSLFFSLFL